MSGPTRTGQTSTRRFQPYGTFRAREAEHQNAEADPLAITLAQVAHVDLPTPQPTGGLTPEITADAETDETFTEEQEAPVSNFYRPHIPRVTDWSFGIRRNPSAQGSHTAREYLAQVASRSRKTSRRCAASSGTGRASGRLQPGTKHWPVSTFLMEPDDAPNIGCDAEVLEYIKTIRQGVYPSPCLKTGNVRPCPEGSTRHSINEWKRRNAERTLMAELSRFYQRRPQDRFWNRPLLLKEGEYECNHMPPRQRHSAYLCSLQF